MTVELPVLQAMAIAFIVLCLALPVLALVLRGQHPVVMLLACGVTLALDAAYEWLMPAGLRWDLILLLPLAVLVALGFLWYAVAIVRGLLRRRR